MQILFLFFLSLFLWSCDGFYNAPPSTPSPSSSPSSSSSIPTGSSSLPLGNKETETISKWGVVRCSPDTYSHFNNELRGFLSSAKDPADIDGQVNCLKERKDLKGGMLLTGEISFENGEVFDLKNPPSDLKLKASSYLEIHIVRTDDIPLARLTLHAVPLASTVSGKNAILTFEDKKGRVSLDGAVDEKGILKGPFKYENYVDWKGGSGKSGTIGYFNIHVCGLFDCQE